MPDPGCRPRDRRARHGGGRGAAELSGGRPAGWRHHLRRQHHRAAGCRPVAAPRPAGPGQPSLRLNARVTKAAPRRLGGAAAAQMVRA
ncbi:hypothetical protein VARIO8X_120245 [Burkholderiales bacterium 8X]|nr:hypothetical protein VARIO8X_120245 [Burkholderiales bacterium 8X]